jgi:hypothetical protein
MDEQIVASIIAAASALVANTGVIAQQHNEIFINFVAEAATVDEDGREKCSNTKIPEGIKVSLPGRDCMTEDRMTTHGWGACTSVEGTRAPSMGDAIERTIDSTRLSQEKSSLGQNRVPLYFPSRLLPSSQTA